MGPGTVSLPPSKCGHLVSIHLQVHVNVVKTKLRDQYHDIPLKDLPDLGTIKKLGTVTAC